MVRPVHSAVLTALEGQSLRPVHLVEMVLQQVTVRFNDSPRPVVFQGQTWHPAGYLLGIGQAAERLDIAIEQVAVSLSGVDQAMVSVLLQYDYRNRRVRIYRGYLGTNHVTLIGEPILVWEGRSSHVVIGETPPGSGIGDRQTDGASAITVHATNVWYDHQRAPGRVLSDACQRAHFPDDRGLEFSGKPFENLPWGER